MDDQKKKNLAVATGIGSMLPFGAMGVNLGLNKWNESLAREGSDVTAEMAHKLRSLGSVGQTMPFEFLRSKRPVISHGNPGMDLLSKATQLPQASTVWATSKEVGDMAEHFATPSLAQLIDDMNRGDMVHNPMLRRYADSPEGMHKNVRKILESFHSTTPGAQRAAVRDLLSNHGIRAMIEAPAHNPYIMAHELGHVKNDEAMVKLLDKIRPGLGDKGLDALTLSTTSAGNLLKNYVPAYAKFLQNYENKYPFLLSFIKGPLSLPVPAMASGALAMSQTARDVIRKLVPLDATDRAMSWVEENPELTAVSGYAPMLMNELATGVSGAKLTRDFWAGEREALRGVGDLRLADAGRRLGKSLAGMKAISPNLEALKFLGHNALANSTYMMKPMGLMLAAYIANQLRSGGDFKPGFSEDVEIE